jgi:hypothetical protein
MGTKSIMLEIIKRELKFSGCNEVNAVGEFSLSEHKPILFPGGVYGFFVELTKKEAVGFYQEAYDRQATFVESLDKFKPIKDNFYPIYWGKDKSIGKRPYEHLKDPKGTGSIRLSTYKSLKDKRIISITIIVDNNDKFETHLQNKFPHLLLTKTAQHNTTL